MKRPAQKQLGNERGIALVMTLLIVVVLGILGGVFVLRSLSEWRMADRNRRLTQALYISEAGTDAALERLDTLINTYLLNTINNTNSSVVVSVTQSYVASGDGLGFLVLAVKNGGVPQLTLNGTEADYSIGATSFGAGNYQYTIVISEKNNPFSSGVDQWDFPYYFRIAASGNSGDMQKRTLLVGDFTVRVQRDNFAKYALFTNQQTLPDGTQVWFTNRTNFAGPIHTNDRFNFALNPSGVFDGQVTQEQQSARFYNNGWPVLLDADFNGARDIPTFNGGFNRGVDTISLSSSVEKADVISQATGGSAISGNGIYVPQSGGVLSGGIYVEGDASVELSVDAQDNAVYTIQQGTTTKKITVNRTLSQTSVETVGGSTNTYSGLPDGMDDIGTVLFVNGNITSLEGTVQKDTELTISSENDIVITDNLEYSDYTPAQNNPGDTDYVPPNADGTDNLLGIVSWDGDVRIGTSAPDNVNVHGSILVQNGIFQVDNYNNTAVGSRGTATLLGGVISDFYGAFGLFNGTTGQQISGFGRNFVYDDRLLVGKAPPYFPSLNTFIAFTNDITDKITLQEGGG